MEDRIGDRAGRGGGAVAAALRLVPASKVSPYRPATPIFDAYLWVVASTYVTGVLAGLAWLAVRVRMAAESNALPITPRLVAQVLTRMRNGPAYFLFVGLAMAGGTALLMAVRSRGSLDEEETGRPPRACPVNSRPLDAAGRRHLTRFAAPRHRRRWEAPLAVWGGGYIVLFCAIVLLLTIPFHGPATRTAFWIYALAATLLGAAAVAKECVRCRRCGASS